MTEETGHQIAISDISVAVSAIDMASKAGAFDGNNMEIIGAARNRLQAAVQEAQEAQAAAETPSNANSGIQDNVGVVDEAEVVIEE